jgi:methylmalonyl-CoA mutase
MLKHTGELPIIGVNTFRNPMVTPCTTSSSWPAAPRKKSRASSSACRTSTPATRPKRPSQLKRLQQAVIDNSNVFEVLMDAVRVCSLGQITNALFEVGGQYRRNM